MKTSHPFLHSVLVVGGPLVLAVVEVLHPHPHDLFELDTQSWLAIPYAQIPLFPLAALAMLALVRDHQGVAPMICRVALFVFSTSYIAFDTVADPTAS